MQTHNPKDLSRDTNGRPPVRFFNPVLGYDNIGVYYFLLLSQQGKYTKDECCNRLSSQPLLFSQIFKVPIRAVGFSGILNKLRWFIADFRRRSRYIKSKPKNRIH